MINDDSNWWFVLPDNNEEVLLKQALEMSMQVDTPAAGVVEKETKSTPSTAPDFNTMSEEEQIAYAMQMSLASSSGNISG